MLCGPYFKFHSHLYFQYTGYTSCPLLTQYGKVVMAEYGYDLEIMETFPFDQASESRLNYLVKTEILPRVYWNGLVR